MHRSSDEKIDVLLLLTKSAADFVSSLSAERRRPAPRHATCTCCRRRPHITPSSLQQSLCCSRPRGVSIDPTPQDNAVEESVDNEKLLWEDAIYTKLILVVKVLIINPCSFCGKIDSRLLKQQRRKLKQCVNLNNSVHLSRDATIQHRLPIIVHVAVTENVRNARRYTTSYRPT